MSTTARRLAHLAALFVVMIATAAGAQESSGGRYFEIDRLNEGLGPVLENVNRDTPQALMESFLRAAEAGDWQTAAHALDLGRLEPDEQARAGPVLAKQLHEVVRRGMWLDWNDLPDRPDALLANASAKNPMAGEPRRNVSLALIELDDRPVSIRIARVKPGDEDPVWVFSRQTVGNITAMYEKYGPTTFEQSLPTVLQGKAFWTLTWWEVVALPLILLAAIVAAGLVHDWMGWVRQRQPSHLAGNVIEALRTPVALLTFVGTFLVAEAMLFTFSGAVNIFLKPLETMLFVIALTLIAVRIVDAVLDRVVRNNLEEMGGSDSAEERNLYTNISAVRRVAIVLAFVVGGALVLIQTNAFQTLGFSLLASAGFIGLLLAFAARTVLSDIMASLQIALAKTARIGDAVLYDGQWCYVEKINFTYVQLQSWDNRRLVVPVSELVSNTFENWSKQDSSMLNTVELRFDHRADVDRLREAFSRFVEGDEQVITKDEAKVQVIGQDERGMVVRFYAYSEDPVSGWNMHCRLREEMLKAAARLEAESSPEPADEPAYLPREREVKIGDFAAKSAGSAA